MFCGCSCGDWLITLLNMVLLLTYCWPYVTFWIAPWTYRHSWTFFHIMIPNVFQIFLKNIHSRVLYFHLLKLKRLLVCFATIVVIVKITYILHKSWISHWTLWRGSPWWFVRSSKIDKNFIVLQLEYNCSNVNLDFSWDLLIWYVLCMVVLIIMTYFMLRFLVLKKSLPPNKWTHENIKLYGFTIPNLLDVGQLKEP